MSTGRLGALKGVGAAVRLATRNSSERVMREIQRCKRAGVKSSSGGGMRG
jgi:hypothetical protein